MKFNQLSIIELKSHLHIKYSRKRDFIMITQFASFVQGEFNIAENGDIKIEGQDIEFYSSLQFDLWCMDDKREEWLTAWRKIWAINDKDIIRETRPFLYFFTSEHLNLVDRTYRSLKTRSRTLLITKPYILECVDS